jgi:glycosyltransferase involved in cell wall biosynthesis
MNSIFSVPADFALGTKKVKNTKLVVCGLARNVEANLPKNLKLLGSLRQYFSSVDIIIVENDSTDGTKLILADWQKEDKKNHLLVEDIGLDPVSKGPFTEHRISLMANFRNKYLEKANAIGSFDFALVIDLDIFKFDIHSIIATFASAEKWDIVSGFGRNIVTQSLTPVYFDVFALVEKGGSPIQKYTAIISIQKRLTRLCKSKKWIPVDSGFNSLAIYKGEIFQSNAKYGCMKTDSEEIPYLCEHIYFHKQLSKEGFQKQFINPTLRIQYSRYAFPFLMKHIKSYLKYIVGTIIQKFKLLITDKRISRL